MVSPQHEAMHRLFQHDPGTFARAFRALGLPFPDPDEVALLSTDLTEPAPIERRADTVLRISSSHGPFLLVVEAQRRQDRGKAAAWAYYIAFLHTKYELPIVLLIICQDEPTALWAEGPLHIGTPIWPSLAVRPLVLGPHNVPRVTDVATAASDIPLAALSAITHAKEPDVGAILKAFALALRDIGEAPEHNVFAELTALGLGRNSEPAQLWRKLMSIDLSFFRSDVSNLLREQGAVQELVEDILLILERRGVEVPDAALTEIRSSTNREILRTWLLRAATADSIEDLFTSDGH
ncbi:hypothetical protein [Nocardia goodfellowii]|uniref:Transposase (putative) YhgA-like domain-containing protein n=1 Tax=Nocardia goodfellowii TaxID=882446 RepID=A0ABS4QQK1_9NOCA|nr:hypothetical protein [Nocardia goodfellowii]MBP2193430.1 hypothetical protein [Nocardia goodfellowii]